MSHVGKLLNGRARYIYIRTYSGQQADTGLRLRTRRIPGLQVQQPSGTIMDNVCVYTCACETEENGETAARTLSCLTFSRVTNSLRNTL